MARSTRLVILIKNIYTLWGRKRFLVPLTYFPTNLVYPFTLRVTGIMTSENNMSENENTTEDEIIVELTDHLNSVYPSLPMNQDDSI